MDSPLSLRIRDILWKKFGHHLMRDERDVKAVTEARAEIIQAVADEGYVKVHEGHLPKGVSEGYIIRDAEIVGDKWNTYKPGQLRTNVMTGQEWYDRFIEEVQSLKFSEPGLPELSDVFKAARKASGIKETPDE